MWHLIVDASRQDTRTCDVHKSTFLPVLILINIVENAHAHLAWNPDAGRMAAGRQTGSQGQGDKQ